MLAADFRLALRDVGLDVRVDVPAGTCAAIVGRSGAGKTTILRVLAGLVHPDTGTISCGGATWLDTATRVDRPPEARRCALLHQDDALFPHLVAWRNVAFGLRGVARRERRDRAVSLLSEFGVDHLADARPRALSGGERRRVALARALAADPPLLLLDEPFTGLDAESRADARTAVRTALAASGAPAILVTHDPADAVALGAVVHRLADGRLHPDPIQETPTP